jgi:hypothetical protein
MEQEIHKPPLTRTHALWQPPNPNPCTQQHISITHTHTHPLSAPTLPGVVLAPKHDVEVAHKGGGVSSPGRRRNAVHNRAAPAGRCTTSHHTTPHVATSHTPLTQTHTPLTTTSSVCASKTSKHRPSQRTRQEPGMSMPTLSVSQKASTAACGHIAPNRGLAPQPLGGGGGNRNQRGAVYL